MIVIYDNVLSDPDGYVTEVLSGQFVDVQAGPDVFKGIQPRGDDEFSRFLLSRVSGEVAYNFVRRSPLNQPEPNFIHSDEMMGDITAILYLNKHHPEFDGTIMYDDDGNPTMHVPMKYNRCVVFDSKVKHSRAVAENFGEGDNARLIQVIFLDTDERA